MLVDDVDRQIAQRKLLSNAFALSLQVGTGRRFPVRSPPERTASER